MIATLLGYPLVEEVFRSPRTLVYRSRQPDTDRPVVLKVMRQTKSGSRRGVWFKREFEILRRLAGVEGVIEAIALGQDGDRWVMVQEDIGGQAIAPSAGARPMRTAEFLNLASRIAGIVARMHEADFVHKDINPSNIIANKGTGEVRLIDFGIASRLPREATSFESATAMEGTLAYIAPEQTGRMNRPIDFRADLYSLGATFYHLLTGSPPFAAADPGALVHAHLARAPRPIVELRPQVPVAVANIVHKLLAKAPEDRYQSAEGLRLDLEECVRQEREAGSVSAFPLDRRRVQTHLELPERLYGREQETAALMEAFTRVADGGVEVQLIAGYSGVGKSRLVAELYQPITAKAGFFADGKFDQLRRDAPYAVVIHALRRLVRQVLGAHEDRLAAWREQLRTGLGPNGQILLDVLPELEPVIGAQPPIAELDSAERLNVLHGTFSTFIRVFASAAHPLTIFLDDLQWVDAASLRLLESLLVGSDIRHLLLIGAYRDNEVEPGHPLLLALARIADAGVKVDTRTLAPLARTHVTQLLVDATGRDATDVDGLSAVVVAKTGGNPFFTRELLKRLYAEKLLYLEGGRWSWDHAAVRLREISPSVVDLVLGQLQSLPPATARLMETAGVLGNQFELQSLAVAGGVSTNEAWDAVWPAVQAGLLIVMSNAHKLLGMELEPEEAETPIPIRFAHDRIQQAALQLVPAADPSKRAWKIGTLLAGRWPVARFPERLFEIVGHLNAGRGEISTQDARDELAELNLQAARRARSSAAFAAALQYAKIGVELGGEDLATRRRGSAMALLRECVEGAYLTGAYAEMDEWFACAIAVAQDNLEAAPVHEIRIEAFNAQGRPLDAIAHALDFLDALGVAVPRAPSFDDVVAEMGAASAVLARRTIAELEAAPEIADPAIRVAVGLIAKIYSSAYVASPLLFATVCLRQFRLVAEHGNCTTSALSYAVYGLLCAALGNDVATGYTFGALSDRMLARPDIRRVEAQARHLFSCHTRMWREPLSACAEGERLAYRVGLDTGELEFACYGAHVAAKYALFHGHALAPLLSEMEQYTGALQRHRQQIACNSHLPWHQAALNLTRPCDEPHRLVGDVLDAHAVRPALLAVNDRMSISNALTAELLLCTVYARFAEAVEVGTEGNGYLDAVLSQFNQPIHMFLDALSRYALCHEATPERRAELRAVADKSLEGLRAWAVSAPANLVQKVALLEAEVLSLDGRAQEARERYEDAVELARRHAFLLDEALACEAAGRHMLRNGRELAARHHLEDAHEAYGEWGATAVVTDLEQRFPILRPRVSEATVLTATRTIDRTTSGGAGVDFAALRRAAEAISSEVVLSRLLHRLVVTLMENAGASRVLIALDEGQGPRVEAEGTAEGTVEVLASRPLFNEDGASSDLPASVFHFVMRSGAPLIVDDASAHARHSRDPFVQAHGTRSVLCVPIKQHGVVSGVTYLENDHAPAAFTRERAELVRLLAGQIAISVENARLYANLEQRVAERTLQLESRNTFIREVFGRYMSDQVVETLLESRGALRLGGERRVITVMFTDLRGFTALCERINPEQVVRTLNNHLAVMSAVVQRHGGTINAMLGDGLMVLFGAPTWMPDHVDRAILCALEMQKSVAEVNATNAAEGLPDVSMGIGIHTGDVVVGSFGSVTHASYSAIGRHVNLAARVETAAAGDEVFISEDARAATTLSLIVHTERRIEPKGVGSGISVFGVRGVEGKPHLTLGDAAGDRAVVDPPRAVVVQRVWGKQVAEARTPGEIHAIGRRSLELSVDDALPEGADLAIRGDAGTLYAKVIRAQDGHHIAMVTGGDVAVFLGEA